MVGIGTTEPQAKTHIVHRWNDGEPATFRIDMVDVESTALYVDERGWVAIGTIGYYYHGGRLRVINIKGDEPILWPRNGIYSRSIS